MTKLNLLSVSGESRTGDYVIQNLLGRAASCREYVNEVIAVLPPGLRNRNLSDVGAKQIDVDVFGKPPKEIADQLKQFDIHSVVIVPPASARKVEFTEKLLQAIKELSESNKDLKNIILISAIGVDEADHLTELKKFKEIEDRSKKILEKTNINWCILRPGPYMHDLLLYEKQIRENGFLGLPTEDKKICFVDARDVAAAAAVIATCCGEKEMKEEHQGKTFNLTGPDALNGEQIVEMMKQMNEKLKNMLKEGYKSISRKEAEKYLSTIPELDESEIGVLQDMFELAKDGKLETKTGDLQKILGLANIEPRSLREYLEETHEVLASSEA